jgi:hypothetical protein
MTKVKFSNDSYDFITQKMVKHDEDLSKLSNIMYLVVVIVVIMTAALVISVLGIFIDTLHAKIDSTNALKKEIHSQHGPYYR